MNSFDVALEPVNELANRMFDAGERFEPNVAESYNSWDTCPELAEVTAGVQPENDLRGRVFGWFTVVGLLKGATKSKRALWVVECKCGQFEAKRAKKLKEKVQENREFNLCCIECRTSASKRRERRESRVTEVEGHIE